MTDIVRHEVFGNPEKPMIEYFTGYGSTIQQMRPHIRVLQMVGFSVHAFEYDKAILNGGDPALLPGVIDEIASVVEADQQAGQVAGIYGMSLGAFIGQNILRRTTVDRAIFNTGGVSILDTIWNNPRLKEEKKAFHAAGHGRSRMNRLWADVDRPDDNGANKKALLMISEADKTLDAGWSVVNAQRWDKAGNTTEVLKTNRLDHAPTIIRNLFRISRTRKFFKD